MNSNALDCTAVTRGYQRITNTREMRTITNPWYCLVQVRTQCLELDKSVRSQRVSCIAAPVLFFTFLARFQERKTGPMAPRRASDPAGRTAPRSAPIVTPKYRI